MANGGGVITELAANCLVPLLSSSSLHNVTHLHPKKKKKTISNRKLKMC